MSKHRLTDRVTLSANATDAIGMRVADFCRDQWPTAKDMARALGIAVPTAEKIRAGSRPQNRLMDKLAEMYRWSFLTRVYEPVAGAPPATINLREDLAALKSQLAALDARFDALKDEA